jgi:hypothetical protein
MQMMVIRDIRYLTTLLYIFEPLGKHNVSQTGDSVTFGDIEYDRELISFRFCQPSSAALQQT